MTHAQDMADSLPDVLRPSSVRVLLDGLGLRPNKTLGQNFLIDRNILQIIVRAATIGPADTVLEVGPGLGAVTTALAGCAGRVLAVEKDPRLAAFIRARFAGLAHVQLVEADMLDLRVDALTWPGTEGPMRIDALVSNLPYSVGSRILVDVVRSSQPPPRVVVTVQREVAGRLSAGAGSPDYGLLSVWIQRAYRVRTVHVVGPRCFFPEPDVQSAVVLLEQRPDAPVVSEAFYALTRRAFGQRRKQVAKSLTDAGRAADVVRGCLRAIGQVETARPEDLGVDEWVALAAQVGATRGTGDASGRS